MKNTITSLMIALMVVPAAMAQTVPTDVTGLAATPIDAKSIGLTWDAAQDSTGGLVDHYRIYYGTFSVFGAGQGNYDEEINTPNNNNSYVITSLEPETEYFFSVTAIDADGNESAQYAPEVNATTPADPNAATTDTTSPTVASVSAPDNQTVKVVFSENVTLPDTNPEASFTIVEQIDTAKSLNVTAAKLDAVDRKAVLLTTDTQTASVNYIVTAGIAIKDQAGNPIVSGSTDSGLFLGSNKEPASDTNNAENTNTNESENIENTNDATTSDVQDCQEDMSCFLTNLIDCKASKVMEKGSEFEYTLEITNTSIADCNVKYTANKHPNVLFAAAEMECKIPQGIYENVEKYREAFNIVNCSGDLVSGYQAVELTDTTPPEDVTNLLITFTEEMEKYMVTLNWTASINTAKDLVDQILYMSVDRGSTYDAGKSLGDSATNTTVDNLDGGKEYTFKITTKDAAGNESTGAIKSIRLPQTGMGTALMLLGSGLAARRVLRRKED